jgi:hypothetical protein
MNFPEGPTVLSTLPLHWISLQLSNWVPSAIRESVECTHHSSSYARQYFDGGCLKCNAKDVCFRNTGSMLKESCCIWCAVGDPQDATSVVL